jgi:hypothetical protein
MVAIAYPCRGAAERHLRTRRSRVPWSSAIETIAILPLRRCGEGMVRLEQNDSFKKIEDLREVGEWDVRQP